MIYERRFPQLPAFKFFVVVVKAWNPSLMGCGNRKLDQTALRIFRNLVYGGNCWFPATFFNNWNCIWSESRILKTNRNCVFLDWQYWYCGIYAVFIEACGWIKRIAEHTPGRFRMRRNVTFKAACFRKVCIIFILSWSKYLWKGKLLKNNSTSKKAFKNARVRGQWDSWVVW